MYGVSLTLPAASNVGMGTEPIKGYEALIFGWIGLGVIPELANVALLFGWIGYLAKEQSLALVAGIAGFAMSASAPTVYGVPSGDLLAGFWLWLSTMGVFASAACYEVMKT